MKKPLYMLLPVCFCTNATPQSTTEALEYYNKAKGAGQGGHNLNPIYPAKK